MRVVKQPFGDSFLLPGSFGRGASKCYLDRLGASETLCGDRKKSDGFRSFNPSCFLLYEHLILFNIVKRIIFCQFNLLPGAVKQQ